jgi:hypothetical protein
MRRMGRPRTVRKDLPTGLYFDPAHGTYGYRESRGARARKSLGKVSRDQAIRAYVKLRHLDGKPATVGTVGDLIDRYIRLELPRRLRLGKMKAITADEYQRQADELRALWGTRPYAPTPAESLRPDVLRTADIVEHIRSFEGIRGEIAANRRIALLSVVFSNGRTLGLCTYNPCIGAERNHEDARKKVLDQATRSALFAAAAPALRLIATLSDTTAMRKTDARLLQLTQIRDGEIHVEQSKTGRRQVFEITPAVAAVLADAASLPGRSRSFYVFPTRKGTPYTESALQTLWRRAKKKAGLEAVDATFRDLRTTELNAVKAAGGDATGTAGHASAATTDRHYLTAPTRVRPRR